MKSRPIGNNRYSRMTRVDNELFFVCTTCSNKGASKNCLTGSQKNQGSYRRTSTKRAESEVTILGESCNFSRKNASPEKLQDIPTSCTLPEKNYEQNASTYISSLEGSATTPKVWGKRKRKNMLSWRKKEDM